MAIKSRESVAEQQRGLAAERDPAVPPAPREGDAAATAPLPMLGEGRSLLYTFSSCRDAVSAAPYLAGAGEQVPRRLSLPPPSPGPGSAGAASRGTRTHGRFWMCLAECRRSKMWENKSFLLQIWTNYVKFAPENTTDLSTRVTPG